MTNQGMDQEFSPRPGVNLSQMLTYYAFDLGSEPLDSLVRTWTDNYPAAWVYLAIVEALYQGRYKVISVSQLLQGWQRRGKPLYKFNRDFERLVSGRISHPPAFLNQVPRDSKIPQFEPPAASSGFLAKLRAMAY